MEEVNHSICICIIYIKTKKCAGRRKAFMSSLNICQGHKIIKGRTEENVIIDNIATFPTIYFQK